MFPWSPTPATSTLHIPSMWTPDLPILRVETSTSAHLGVRLQGFASKGLPPRVAAKALPPGIAAKALPPRLCRQVLPPRLCFQGFQGFTSRRPPTPRACPRRCFHRSLPKPTTLRARQEAATDALVGFFKEGLVIHHYLGVRLNGPRTGPLPPFTPCKARSPIKCPPHS